MPDPTLYLFDGYNVLHAAAIEDRSELIDGLASFVAIRGARGIVVFDGGGRDASFGPLEVRFAANADAVLEVQRQEGSLDAYLWTFTGGAPIANRWRSLDQVPAETAESRAMSKDMKHRGFRFVGPTVCYAFMQATGMVNDHVVGCFRHDEV